MKTIDEVEERLCASITGLLVPLQTERRLQADVFEDLDRATKDLAQLLRGSESLPRKLMNEIYVTLTILRTEATENPQHSGTLLKMASRLEMTFALILKGETEEDRVPGVPRVI